jgi:hypothetical protein
MVHGLKSASPGFRTCDYQLGKIGILQNRKFLQHENSGKLTRLVFSHGLWAMDTKNNAYELD